jgi:basic membrane lipoprotein Med (substrate-binding protein (PBP1-ABC) superfamily)
MKKMQVMLFLVVCGTGLLLAGCQAPVDTSPSTAGNTPANIEITAPGSDTDANIRITAPIKTETDAKASISITEPVEVDSVASVEITEAE